MMKRANQISRIRFGLIAAVLAIPICICAQTSTTNWSIAVLDHILANVQPGQKAAQVGDMMISVSYLQWWRNKLAGRPQPQSAFGGRIRTWPGGNVYYTFSNNVSALKQKAFLDGAAEWAMFANLHFIPRTTQSNYVTIFENPSLEGGQSYVGMSGGQQFLSIGPKAWNRGTICHELGHTLGMVHEQQRSDRDSYVTVFTNNIVPGDEGNFVLLTDSRNEGPYDFLSIMQYPRNGLSISNTLDTIEPLPAYIQFINIMGRRNDPVLSAGDRAGMAAVYGPGPAITNIVTNTQDCGPGSLRAALYYAFDHPGTTITFNIPISDPGFSNNVFNIQPTDRLPGVWSFTTIDGATEPANPNPYGPAILLNGEFCWSLNATANGLLFLGTNSVVRSVVVNNFPNFGILIDGSNSVGNTVSGCYLGIDPSGSFAVTNGVLPLQISGGAISNTIGGTTAAARNVMSGSTFQGLAIRDAGTHFNTVEGNYIGVNAAGTRALPNAWEGILIFGGAESNLVGGYTASARNIISGNASQGVAIADPGTSGNVVAGNYIGLNAAGTAAVPNGTSGYAGVDIFGGAKNNLIGGLAASAANVISGNSRQGVAIADAGTSGNEVLGNCIGANPAGTAAIGNAWAGVNIFGGATGNFVGGTVSGAGNLISGNNGQGVVLQDAGTSGNFVQGNFIGLNSAGTASLPNVYQGAAIWGGAESNVIGGYTPSARNVISGNGGQGVTISDAGSADNVVAGNYIGLDASGTAAISNAWEGLAIWGGAQSNLIGGYAARAGNIISGNRWSGVAIIDTNTIGNVVAGNYIGLNAAGTAAISNSFVGIELDTGTSQNVIGGNSLGAGNVISGNSADGVLVRNPGTSENVVQGNIIGMDPTATVAIPNAGWGVDFYGGAQSNLIGGLAMGDANLISQNSSGGVSLSDAATANNTVRGNSIFLNARRGMVLYNSANGSISSPTLFSATLGTRLTITGLVTGMPNSTYHMDFYANPIGDLEGMTYLGARDVSTGSGGTANFSMSLNARIPAGNVITSTITDSAGNTSSFSGGTQITMVSTVNDGIPDSWREQYFGGSGMTTNSQSCATCDPDHDGMNNMQEFLAGTNPTNAASVLKPNPLSPKTSDRVADFLSASGIVYRVEYRDDLARGIWSIAADQVVGTGTNIFIADPNWPSTTARFYRLQILW